MECLDRLALLLWLAATASIAALFLRHAPDQCMDEPFHVPQTQQYCRGEWRDWDPKITTFPGLYIAGTAYATALHRGSQLASRVIGTAPLTLEAACGTAALRSLNLLFGGLCLVLLVRISRRLHPKCTAGQTLATALTLALFPLHFFFQFLYYTDVASLTFVLATYLACLERRYVVSALAAAAATGCRQTNAVWAAFVLWVGLLQECSISNTADDNTIRHQARLFVSRCWQHRGRLLKALWPLAAVPAAFAAFVVVNGGVVVGDRAAHAPIKHLAQPLYFALFSAVALAPAALNPDRLRAAWEMLRRLPPFAAVVALPVTAACLVAAVDRFTVVHPYLLADNRHYTFYLWKNLLGRSPLIRKALVPAYMFSGWSLWGLLRKRQSPLWCLGWAGATCLVLIPAALVEFRYFTTPFLLLALHMPPVSPRQLALTAAAYAAVNAATIYVFLFRPYTWGDGSTARFMW